MWRTAFSLASPGGASGRLSVLIFHRVLPRPDTLIPDEVHADQFDQICRWVARWFNVLPLGEAVQRLRAGELPRRAMAITFDDGYADNHDVAMPILQRHGLTSTFFVAPGFLDGGRMWNDTIIESLRVTTRSQLDLRGIDETLGCHALDHLAQRQSALKKILSVAKYFEPARRLAAVDELARLAGVQPPSDLMMSSGQVVAMQRGGMTIGAHTLTHPILKQLSPDQMRAEIVGSKDRLESLLGMPVRLFAYPNGKPGADYDHHAVAIVKQAGFDAAMATAWGAARRTSDPFQLPRFTPWDRTAHGFAFRLLRNLGDRH